MKIQYEYTVETILVPWKQGASWPYLPAQDTILAKMMEMGSDGWQVIEHMWGPTPPNDNMPRKVNLWASRMLPILPGA